MMKPITACILCIAALSATAAPAAVTFQRAGVFAQAQGGFGGEGFTPQLSSIVTALGATPIQIAAEREDATATSSYRATAAAFASFTSAATGALTFNASSEAATQSGAPSAIARGIANTVYYFGVDRLSRISFDYSIERSVSPIDFPSSAYIRLVERDASTNISTVFLNQSGFFGDGARTYLLGPGNYSLDFSNNVATSYTRVTSGSDGESIAGVLNFNIAAVPEPATWATMMLGFGLVGAAVRRRRTAVPA